MNPKMHSEIYSNVKTFEVLFNLEESNIDPKNIALILVGVPKSLVLSIIGVVDAGFLLGVFTLTVGVEGTPPVGEAYAGL
jgi:hypothetical protein